MAAIKKRLNLWIAIGLIFVNLFTWAKVLLALTQPYVVGPIRNPEIVELLAYIASGAHSGEKWEVTLTELEAEQTITWYLQKYPQIPFAHPRIKITPDYVDGEGDVLITGLRIHVSGKARVTLIDDLPVMEILDLNLPLPRSMSESIEKVIQVQLRRAELLPVRFTSAEWGDGVVVVRGVIR
ncbi:MAG: hypothetical protein CVU38_04260 [Chloroflexi bacterium HGW-Chloroflexi-1]|nr:MAG: hypothetical protein CVU38_04260 [Chloroflexi bacterium HGW-Chloroflexi-1]